MPGGQKEKYRLWKTFANKKKWKVHTKHERM